MAEAFCTTTTAMEHLPTLRRRLALRLPAGHRARFGLTTTTTGNWIYLSAGSLILTSPSTNSVATSAPENATTAAREVTRRPAAGFFTTTATGLSRTFPWNQECQVIGQSLGRRGHGHQQR